VQIHHRITLTGCAKNDAVLLQQNGIEPILINDHYIIFEIEESNPFWPQVATMIGRPATVDIIRTTYTAEELASAEHLIVESSWHQGYPQPEDDYAGLTYHPTSSCAGCGIHGAQLIPFRMLREPKWGRRQILQLNWLFDEYFVTPEAWRELFKPFGIDCLPVLHQKSGQALKTAVQLEIPARASSLIDPTGLPAEICTICNRSKFLPLTRGRFPHLDVPIGVHLAKTQDFFGSGGSAWQAVIVSHELYIAIQKHSLKGVHFGVVAKVGQQPT
jgi:hypothetical protein